MINRQADRPDPCPGRVASATPVVAAALLAVGAAVITALSFSAVASSYEEFQSFAGRFVPDGNAASLSKDMFDGMKMRAWGVAAAYLALAALLIALRGYLSEAIAAVPDRLRAAGAALRTWYRESSSAHRWALTAILLVGIIVRLAYMGQPVRNDEAMHALGLANRSFLVIVAAYYDPNNQILHTLLSRAAYLIFGFSEWSFRLPAFLSGLLLLPLVYVFARRFYGGRTALLATAFAASSTLFIVFSTFARGYLLMALFFLAAFLAAARVRRVNDPVAWTLLALFGALGVWTIPLMAYALGVVYVWLFLSMVAGNIADSKAVFLRHLIVSGIAAVLVAVVLYAPAIVALDPLAAIQSNTAFRAGMAAMPDKIKPLIWLWGRWHDGVVAPLVWLSVAGVGLSLVAHARMARDRVPILLPTVVWLVPIYILQPFAPPHRFYLFLLPLYHTLAAAGIAWGLAALEGRFAVLGGRATPAAAMLLCAGILAGVLADHSVEKNPDGWRMYNAEEVVAFLAENAEPGDRVIAGFGRTGTYHHRFYGNLYDLPPNARVDQWNRPGLITGDTRRVFVVVHCRYEGRNTKHVLDRRDVDLSDFDGPTMVAEFPEPYPHGFDGESRNDDTWIYLYQRRPHSAQSSAGSRSAQTP